MFIFPELHSEVQISPGSVKCSDATIKLPLSFSSTFHISGIETDIL